MLSAPKFCSRHLYHNPPGNGVGTVEHPMNLKALVQEQSTEEAESDSAWDVEHLASDEDGLVIFDGGTYSRGPTMLIELDAAASSEADEALEADKERLKRQLSLEASPTPLRLGQDKHQIAQ